MEAVTELFAHVFRDFVPPVHVWCGLLLGAHALERKPYSGVVERNPDSKKKLTSSSGNDIVDDDSSGDPPRGRKRKASLVSANWAHNRNVPTETNEGRSWVVDLRLECSLCQVTRDVWRWTAGTLASMFTEGGADNSSGPELEVHGRPRHTSPVC